jgi:hypothetical protein
VRRRWRRIVGRRRRPRNIGRALIKIRLSRRWIAYVGPLRQPLGRSTVGAFDRTRRIRTPVRAGWTGPLDHRSSTIQHCTRPRRCTSDRDKSRANPDLLHRRHCPPVESQSLFMIHGRPEAAVEAPRSRGHRTTIDGHQPQSPYRVDTARRPQWRNRHPPSRRMSTHNDHRGPTAATTWSPSPAEGVALPWAFATML